MQSAFFQCEIIVFQGQFPIISALSTESSGERLAYILQFAVLDQGQGCWLGPEADLAQRLAYDEHKDRKRSDHRCEQPNPRQSPAKFHVLNTTFLVFKSQFFVSNSEFFVFTDEAIPVGKSWSRSGSTI